MTLLVSGKVGTRGVLFDPSSISKQGFFVFDAETGEPFEVSNYSDLKLDVHMALNLEDVMTRVTEIHMGIL